MNTPAPASCKRQDRMYFVGVVTLPRRGEGCHASCLSLSTRGRLAFVLDKEGSRHINRNSLVDAPDSTGTALCAIKWPRDGCRKGICIMFAASNVDLIRCKFLHRWRLHYVCSQQSAWTDSDDAELTLMYDTKMQVFLSYDFS